MLVRVVRESSAFLQVVTEAAIIPALDAADNVRVPDVAVAPGGDGRGDQVVADPLLIAEILSPGTAAATRDNVRAYATLASVHEIVFVHSSRIQADIYRRRTLTQWADDPGEAAVFQR